MRRVQGRVLTSGFRPILSFDCAVFFSFFRDAIYLEVMYFRGISFRCARGLAKGTGLLRFDCPVAPIVHKGTRKQPVNYQFWSGCGVQFRRAIKKFVESKNAAIVPHGLSRWRVAADNDDDVSGLGFGHCCVRVFPDLFHG